LGDGSGVRLTTAKYFTPKGRSIQAEGIVPDIVVESNIVRSKERPLPVLEKDLEKHINAEKEIQKPKTDDVKRLESEDFQISMGLQILKSWNALRGK
ncbi:MAG TPA: peptidase S41, partial [Deltaproteobacteria bacterium]|nr:peptidase S41 [Deltaproteobacteria bacterium]